MKNIFFLVYSLMFSVSVLQAQKIIPITKSEALIKAAEENRLLKISEQDLLQAKADYTQTNAVFLPNISVSHTGISTTNPLMAFGSKLNQEILTQSDFNPTLLNDPSKTENFATKFEIQQPLINVDGLYQRKAAKIKMDAMALQSQRKRDFVNLEVEKAYMQLQLSYKAVEVLEKALEAATENKKIADNSFKQGYLQRADILSVEVRVAEIRNNLQSAKSNIENVSNYLSFLMNDKDDVIYSPKDELSIEASSNLELEIVPEERSDMKAMKLVSNAYETMHKANKMAFLPRLNAFGSYELYDDKVFQGDASGYLVGAQLSWDLFQGSKRIGVAQKSKAQFEKSKLEYEQYVSQNQLELNKANRLLTDASNKLELTKLALDQSEESLRIRTNRFKEGLEKTSDLLTAEAQYVQKQLEFYQTIFEYNYALSYLQFLTKDN